MIENESMIPSPEDLQDFHVEYNLASAFDYYLLNGMFPGNFAAHIIYGDYQGAMARAHQLFKIQRPGGDFTYAHLLYHYMQQVMPSEVMGIDNFNHWTASNGLLGEANSDVLVFMKLSGFEHFSSSHGKITDHPWIKELGGRQCVVT
jgi:hypothetical protein